MTLCNITYALKNKTREKGRIKRGEAKVSKTNDEQECEYEFC